MTQVKICGIRDQETLEAVIAAGADYAGFVLYPPSPRHVSLETAMTLSQTAGKRIKKVALLVDPGAFELSLIANLGKIGGRSFDFLQLHGDETPQQVREAREITDLPVIKAVRVRAQEDLALLPDYEDAADWLLFDAKSMAAKGGTGESFDWGLLKERGFKKPWMLSGGLNASNVRGAIALLDPPAVDVSTGVEDAPGVKNTDKIEKFIRSVKSNV